MEDESGNPILKIILVGDSGVGKTSLVNSYFKQPFEGQTQPTVAPAFCGTTVKIPGGKSVDLHIWDTAGQERFQSIGQMFYRESHIAFICYDVNKPENVSKWINNVRDQVPACILFIVGTKADLITEDTDSITQHGEDLAKRFNAKMSVLTSSQTGMGVQELFESAAECVHQVSPVPIQEPKQEKKKGGCC